ncbi:MAG: hypothetical protein R3Y26_07045 [Rikenellaceae bacterium]
MKEFDIYNIERDMPYKMPKNDFFGDFSAKLYAKIESDQILPYDVTSPIIPMLPEERNIVEQSKFNRLLTSRFAPLYGAAAMVTVIGLTVFSVSQFSVQDKKENMFAIERDIVESMDAFLSTLSDEEFSQLLGESSKQRDIYVNLPKLK